MSELEKYVDRLARLIVFMLQIGFTKEETKTAVNSLRILKDLSLITEILGDEE